MSWEQFAKEKSIQLYETDEDRQRELDVANMIQPRIRGVFQRLAQYSIFDFAILEQNKVTSLAEIKTRTCNHDKYKTYYISQKKILNAHTCEAAGLPVDLFVHWADQKIGQLRISRVKPDYYTRSQRTDSEDPKDFGLVGHYSLDKFFYL